MDLKIIRRDPNRPTEEEHYMSFLLTHTMWSESPRIHLVSITTHTHEHKHSRRSWLLLKVNGNLWIICCSGAAFKTQNAAKMCDVGQLTKFMDIIRHGGVTTPE